jgi:SAM-dependent methyltransferase
MTRLSDFVGNRSLGEIYDDGWVPAVLDPFARDFTSYVSSGDVVLDVGCGTGLVTLYASEAAGPEGRVVGIDPTDFLMQRARSKTPAHPIEWIDGSVEDAPFGDDTFDVVLCQQALQYMEDPLLSLKAMGRMLKPGGTLAVSIWSPVEAQVPVGDFEKLIARHLNPEFSTIHAFTFGGLDRITSLASEAGLTVVSAETVSRPTTYESVEACVELMLGGAGRLLPDGTLGMGLFDLEDPRYVQGVEDLIVTLEKQWGDYMQGDQLVVPYFTDVVVVHKE